MSTMLRSGPVYSGGIKEVIHLLLPMALMTFSMSIVGFVERLFFAQLSAEAMEVAISVAYMSRIFQIPCTVLAMMAQVYVGRLQGARNEVAIGSHVWQFIWFSLLSVFFTVPFSILYGVFYYEGTVVETSVFSYFFLVMSINFLYPLVASLSCFYLGRGKIQLILFMTLVADAVNLFLAYVLIFGVEGWIPALGLIGGAIGTLVAQSALCLVLFGNFLSAQNRKIYGSDNWRFRPSLFLECTFPGFLRALNLMSVFVCWTFIAHLMIEKKGDYLLIWSLGSTIGLFLPFIGNAICQALTTITSNILGSGETQLLGRVTLSGIAVVSMIAVLAAIPMLLFPVQTCYILFPNLDIPDVSVRNVFLGLWLSFTFGSFAYVPISRILSYKDTQFFLYVGSFCWLNGFVVMFFAMNVFEMPADQCWIILSFSNFFDLVLYSWRANRLTFQKNMLPI